MKWYVSPIFFVAFAVIFHVAAAKVPYCKFPDYPRPIKKGETVSIPGKCRKVTCRENLTLSALTYVVFLYVLIHIVIIFKLFLDFLYFF